MDALHLYKEPCHPARPIRIPDGFRHAKHLERYQSPRLLKYYFADFGQSVRFASPDERQRLVRPGGQDRTVPEEQDSKREPADPFAIDVYCIGSLFVQHLLKVSSTCM